jgi:CheY-like chemotaxis protein
MNAKVLVVEDDKDLNQAYCLILNHFGYRVESAFNGQQALKKSKKFAPDVILLDLLMPIMGGLEFLKVFKRDPKNKAKVVIFTNMEDTPELREAYVLGAQRYIIKSLAMPQNLNKLIIETLAEP